jgi:hypothetical protein
VVDVEHYDSDLSLTKVAEESIAKRTRSGKAKRTRSGKVSATVSAPSKEDKGKKKSAAKPVKYGPTRGWSNVVT